MFLFFCLAILFSVANNAEVSTPTCFVVSLPDSMNRRERMSSMLAEINLTCQFWDGVRIQSESDVIRYKQQLGITSDVINPRLSNGQRGCMFAFLTLLQHIASLSIPDNTYFLILEDDIIYTTKQDYSQLDWRKYEVAEYVLIHVNKGYGTQAQLVSAGAARKLVANADLAFGLDLPIDWIWLPSNRKIPGFQSVFFGSLFAEDGVSPSDIARLSHKQHIFG